MLGPACERSRWCRRGRRRAARRPRVFVARLAARWTSSASLTENTTFCGGLLHKLRKQVDKPLGWFAITVNLAIPIATLTMILETLPGVAVGERRDPRVRGDRVRLRRDLHARVPDQDRRLAARALGRLICSFMTLVDVGAITPFYLNLVIQEPQCWTGVLALLNGNAWPPLPREATTRSPRSPSAHDPAAPRRPRPQARQLLGGRQGVLDRDRQVDAAARRDPLLHGAHDGRLLRRRCTTSSRRTWSSTATTRGSSRSRRRSTGASSR